MFSSVKDQIRHQADADPAHLIDRFLGHLDPSQWVHESAYDECVSCKSDMTNGHRHHCRLCGNMFCSRCSGRYHIPSRFKQKGKLGAVRVCYGCRDASFERRRGFELLQRSFSPEERQDGIELEADRVFEEQHKMPFLNPDAIPKALFNIRPPIWHKTGVYDNCAKCQEQLSSSHSHNCRCCGRWVCSTCSYKMEVPDHFKLKGKKGPQRVCDRCRYLVVCGAGFADTSRVPSPTSPAPVPVVRATSTEVATNVQLQYVATCGAPGCEKPRVSRGFCSEHSSDTQRYTISVTAADENDSKVAQQSATDETLNLTELNRRLRGESRFATGQNTQSSVSRPYNVRHVSHVDNKMQWTGQNLEEVFHLTCKLGEGAFGEVWKGVHRKAGFEIAIKMILATDDEVIEAYKREIDIIRQCNHPNTVCYFGCWGPDSQGRLWILMDLCEVGSLLDMSQVIRTQLHEKQIAYCLASILSALVYLHAKRISHRDLKANNVFLTRDGVIKLGDFGVANQRPGLTDDQKDSLNDADSSEMEIVGTPNWMSPEMIEEKVVDFKGDIWALGITAIELAEEVPYEGMTVLRILRAIRSSPPPTLKNTFLWSDSFRDFVKCCLVKDPLVRPSSLDLLKHPFIDAALQAMAETKEDGTSVASPMLPLVKRYMVYRRKGSMAAPGSYDVMRMTESKTGDGTMSVTTDSAAADFDEEESHLDNIDEEDGGEESPRAKALKSHGRNTSCLISDSAANLNDEDEPDFDF